jgi:2,3-bisphosphoglycerate-dependent phosphoglycerate mutase
MRVLLIRHGESELNTRTDLVGGFSPETPLTPTGEAQARALGEHLAREGIKIDLAYASTAVRARETARIALAAIGHGEPRIDPRLAELGQGVWEGRLRVECYTEAVRAQIKAQGKHFKLEGGESMIEVAARMRAWHRDAMAEPATTIAMFGHGLAIRCLLGDLFEWDHATTYGTPTPNTSISKITRGPDDAWTLVDVGATPHL